MERCEVRIINPKEYTEQIWEVTSAAYRGYENADNEKSKEEYLSDIVNAGYEIWGAFAKDTKKLTGWMACENKGEYTMTVLAKYHPEMQKDYRPSDALHCTVLTHYLNILNQRYICSGTRNINHKTNSQAYKIEHWGFRKAYCDLNIIYRQWFGFVIRLLYQLRWFLLLFDKVTVFHQVNSLLLMEEISRECKRTRKHNMNCN